MNANKKDEQQEDLHEKELAGAKSRTDPAHLGWGRMKWRVVSKTTQGTPKSSDTRQVC